jgi:hypothetical protein
MKQQHTPEEWVPADDAIIGRAFRWSLGVIVITAAAAGVVIWKIRSPEERPAPLAEVRVAPEIAASPVQPPPAPFTNITRQAGITFQHYNGARGDRLLPETMGGGCAWVDYDTDGDADLFLVNSTYWPDDADPPAVAPTLALYRNDGGGHFEDVSAAAGLNLSLYGMGVAAGDYDGDGDEDLYVTAVGPNRLLRNDGGHFHDVTADAGAAGAADAWSTSAGFFDHDRDGDLDLIVANYVQWSRDIDFAVDYRLVGLGRAYGPPNNFQGTHCTLLRNEGNGTFTDVSAAAGIEVVNPDLGTPAGKALGLAIADLDVDGWLDVIVANDTVRKFLFHNRRDGTFAEVGEESGVAYDRMGNATGAMGADVADYRNDGVLGVGISNFANEMTSLYLAGSDPLQFTDVAIVEGIGAPSRQVLKFGLFFFDFDLDGRQDLLQCNGHLEQEINKVQPSQQYRQPGQLFWNAGPDAVAAFVEVPRAQIGDLAEPIVGRGAAYADFDGDGDLDVVLTQIAGPPLLLRNDQNSGHHWLRVKLVAVHGPADAIGARVELHAPAGVQRRQVMPTRSYLSQVELPVTFGLGGDARVERLKITWPDGSTQDVVPPGVDQLIVVRQPTVKNLSS